MDDWEVRARVEIRALVDRNAALYDLDRFAEAYAVFAQDGVLEPVPGQQPRSGRADILSRFGLRPDGRLGDYRYVRHNITTHFLDSISATEAVGFTYYLVYMDGSVSTAGYYVDRFVVIDGAWAIAHRSVHQDLSLVPPPTHL